MNSKIALHRLLTLCFVFLFFGNIQAQFSLPSSAQAKKNYKNINTNGTIEDYKSVPNVKVASNQNIYDPHNLLTKKSITYLQSVIDGLNTEKDYEIMIVCLNSIGGATPRTWGTDLFNYWGIGDKETENGLLILVVNDVHRLEFITGRGLESVLTDTDSKKIQDTYMFPYFKKNDYVGGIVSGMDAVSAHLYNKAVLYDSNPDDVGNETKKESIPFYKKPLFRFYAAFVILLTSVYLIFLFISFSKSDLYKRYQTMRYFSLWVFPILAPIPFLILIFYTKKLLRDWRNTERISFDSGELMHKLEEKEEDEFLSKGQIAEEVVHSIDYDVWVTVDRKEVLILAYKSWFNNYNRCAKCNFLTYTKLYDKAIVSASYSSAGKGEKKYTCSNCGHEVVKHYKIPRKQRSRNTGSFGGGSFGGGGGGGSFGGGSSRGGGSGGGW
ncbi:TPM domain-containing protein [Crocinitomix catalasitica]|uniref:TPM domain-containing protein n=1 Tax=Crocinitomix catalasitica TaxID=184607 RepID=UPI0004891015|nr:TPM domain-containing protein [Crocinitomix catalasitica]